MENKIANNQDIINNNNSKIKENINNNKKAINSINRISLKYQINNANKIKIFGEKFVLNNSKKCLFLHKKKTFILCEYFKVLDTNSKDLEIELIGIENLTNLS